MRRMAVPVCLLAAFGSVYGFWQPITAWVGLTYGWTEPVRQAVGLVTWCMAAWAGNRALHVLIWTGWFERRSGMPVPKLLTDLSGVVIWVAAVLAALALVYQVNVSGLVTASGVTIAIIGFALRNMIADIFTGIALGVERPLKAGDWIELEDGTVGCVTEINWRATRLVTREELTKVVPNGYLATHPFTNYHTPDAFFRDKFEIVLGYDVTAHQAERILLSAVSQIPESTAIPRKPEVRITEYTERGLKWELRYWVPNYPDMSTLRYKIQRNVLRNLHYAGVQVPRRSLDITDVHHPAAQRDEISEDVGFLRAIEVFDALETDELAALCDKMARRLCVAGTPVVTQGEATTASLFIVKEGFLDVTIDNERGEAVTVGWLAPGMFFGEMSLLTGAARSATVTPSVDAVLFEVTRADIEPVLQQRDGLVRRLSEVLADRQMRNDASLKAASAEETEVHRRNLTDRILGGIVRFFGLGGGDQEKVRNLS